MKERKIKLKGPLIYEDMYTLDRQNTETEHGNPSSLRLSKKC